MWALKELRKSERPFTSSTLLEKIRKYKLLPKGQVPELLGRRQGDELVWISPFILSENQEQILQSSPEEHPRPEHEWIDLRLHYHGKVDREDVIQVARTLSQRIAKGQKFRAQHAALLRISSKDSRKSEAILASVDHFRVALGKKRKRACSTVESPSFNINDPVLVSTSSGDTQSITIQDQPLQINIVSPSSQPPARRRRFNPAHAPLRGARSLIVNPVSNQDNLGPWFYLQMLVYSSIQGVVAPLANRVSEPWPYQQHSGSFTYGF